MSILGDINGELGEAQDLAQRHQAERDDLQRRYDEVKPFGQVRPARSSSPLEREELVSGRDSHPTDGKPYIFRTRAQTIKAVDRLIEMLPDLAARL